MKENINKFRDVLSQTKFWKIQGLNLLLLTKKVVNYVFLTLGLTLIVFVTSKGLRLSSYQKGSILTFLLIIVIFVELYRAFQNVFLGKDMIWTFVRMVIGSLLATLIIYLAFSIELTGFEKINDLVLRWGILAILFKISEMSLLRKISSDIKNGGKADWVRTFERQVINKYENGLLIGGGISDKYALRYSPIVLCSKGSQKYERVFSRAEEIEEVEK